MSVRRRRRKPMSRGRPYSPVIVTLGSSHRGSRSLYHQPVADRAINRQAWAALVAGLIATKANGKKAAFARLVGVDPKTIGHWLGGTVDVSEASVRRVAIALNRMPADFLVSIGYYTDRELSSTAPLVGDEDPVGQQIEKEPLPESVKQLMRERLRELRAGQRAAEAAEVTYWLEQYRQTRAESA